MKMPVINFTTQADREKDFSEYLSVALSGDIPAEKMFALVNKYKGEKQPFISVCKDTRLHFGESTEKYCSVIKSVIEGYDSWRSQKNRKKLSEESLKEIFAINAPEGFTHAFSELDLEAKDDIDLADIAWDTNNSLVSIREKVQRALDKDSDDSYGMSYWVHDISSDNKALVCHGGKDYYVVSFSVSDEQATLDDEDNWVPVTQEWVVENGSYLAENDIIAEVYLTDSTMVEKDGLVWKTVAREGTWKYSPGAGQMPVAKPITFVKTGKSDYKNLVVSLEELKSNFEEQAIEHVTVPLTHEDKVHENTGFIRQLKIVENEDGKAELLGGIEFTEPEIKEKTVRGSIANISAGIKFDYIKKDVGKKYNAVVQHAALTNHPWLNGMKPFGVNASENTQILSFSEEVDLASEEVGEETLSMPQGGDKVEVTDAPSTFLSDLGISEDEAKARLAEYAALKAEQKKNRVEDRCRKWQEEGVSPALVLAAKSILEADEGVAVLNLSEDGATKTLTASDVVDRLITAAPKIDLSQDPVKEKDLTGDAPEVDAKNENKDAELSLSERALASQYMFELNMTEEEAIAKAKADSGKSN